MKRFAFLFSCVFMMLCMVPAFGFTADQAGEKAQSQQADPAAKVKEVSLYLYYQKYLNPYLNKNKAKTADRGSTTEPGGTFASNPTSSPAVNEPKAQGRPADRGQQVQEAEKKDSDEKTHLTFHKLESVGLDEVNKTFPQEYKKEYLAELGIAIKLTPLVDLSVGKVQKFERSGDDPWGAHDGGWRLKLQKQF